MDIAFMGFNNFAFGVLLDEEVGNMIFLGFWVLYNF